MADKEELLSAAYECIARYGIAKTTLDDVGREAGVSRATVYRHFATGKDQLVREVVAWEAGRFFRSLAEAVADVDDLAGVLEEALVFAHRAITEHAVLQKILQTEPDLLVPQLTVQSDLLLGLIRAFLAPALTAANLRPGLNPEEAADFVARMVLSFIGAPGQWDLTDRARVRELVDTELLAGILDERR